MCKTSNHQIITQNIFTQAGHLIGNNNYKEKNNTADYNKCDCLFIDHNNRTFWFTTKEHIQHTSKLSN